MATSTYLRLIGLEDMHVDASPVVPVLERAEDELHFMGLYREGTG